MPQDFDDHTPLGQRIRMLGYHLHEVADGAGIDRWHLNDYLHERKVISARHMLRLCAFLKCEPETITQRQ